MLSASDALVRAALREAQRVRAGVRCGGCGDGCVPTTRIICNL